MKKLSVALCVVCMVFSLVMPTSAYDIPVGQSGFLTLEGGQLDPNEEYIDTAYLVLDGVPRKLTAAEYEMIFEDMYYQSVVEPTAESAALKDFGSEPFPLAAATYIQEFFINDEETRDHYDLSQKTAVTPAVNGGSNGAVITSGIVKSFSRTYSGGITANIKSFIEIEFGISDTVETQEQFSASFNVGAGQIMRVVFIPRVHTTVGNYCEYNDQGTLTYIRTISFSDPLQVGNFADGLYQLEDAS